ncbi:MAG TPA: hypothetical protein VGD73_02910 [Pseudonocardia sp.]|uniref:hypothetical protein n=1 Tax=Pseudonocardia sp. TaxID=60912 RepID=UPI002EDAD68A
MSPAEHDQIFDIGLAAVHPFDDMVHLTEGRLALAAGMGATPVAGGHRAALGQGDASAVAAEVEGLALPVEHHRDDLAVTEQVAQVGRRAAAAEVEHHPRACARIHS